MLQGPKRQPRRQEVNDSDDEDGMETIVCNMTGDNWERLLFPTIIDSGACVSVMPTAWCGHVPLRETPQSKAAEFYRVANGHTIYNEGDRLISMMTRGRPT